MVFTSATFLFYFLPITIALYAVMPRRARNALLLTASVGFYIWGSGWLVGTLFVSVVVDYALGFPAERAAVTHDHTLARKVIAASVIANLGLLGWFKYAGWLIGTADDVGIYTGSVPEIVLPIGISFFTFQSMSYTIDVARGRCPHLSNPVDFALYVTLFPQLIAGPIVRFHEIEAQIRDRPLTLALASEGALRFSHGLAKKVIIADSVAPIADAAFAADGDLSTGAAWVGIVAYTLQIYFDFSGYSDMAIGLGLMFGFRFPENFDRPYSALSVTDFWRRWHITLSNWFRDYLYIPLGGSRMANPSLVYRNLLIVFLLTGLWHGANWTFVVWGAYHGAWLLLERALGLRHLVSSGVAQEVTRRIRTLFVVVIGWVFFRADSIGDAVDYLAAMFSFDGAGVDMLDAAMTTRTTLLLVAGSLVALVPRGLVVGPALARDDHRFAVAARAAVMLVALPYALLVAASGSFSPFLYFAF